MTDKFQGGFVGSPGSGADRDVGWTPYFSTDRPENLEIEILHEVEEETNGVVQLANPMPTYTQIWSWKENVDAGIALLRKKRAAAKKDFEKEKPVSYTEEMLDIETITRWNGGKYHEWDQDKKKWVRQKSILCDTKTGNIGWDMTLESNSGKTESELHDRDKVTYSKMKAGQDEEHAWKYSGVCYADHIAGK